MSKIVDLTVTVSEETKSPPSTDMKVALTQHHRGPGFWQVTSVNQSLHTEIPAYQVLALRSQACCEGLILE